MQEIEQIMGIVVYEFDFIREKVQIALVTIPGVRWGLNRMASLRPTLVELWRPPLRKQQQHLEKQVLNRSSTGSQSWNETFSMSEL